MDTAALASSLSLLPLQEIVEVDSIYLAGFDPFYLKKEIFGDDANTRIASMSDKHELGSIGSSSLVDPGFKPGGTEAHTKSCSEEKTECRLPSETPTRESIQSEGKQMPSGFRSEGDCLHTSLSPDEPVQSIKYREPNRSNVQELSDEEDLDALLNMSRVSRLRVWTVRFNLSSSLTVEIALYLNLQEKKTLPSNLKQEEESLEKWMDAL